MHDTLVEAQARLIAALVFEVPDTPWTLVFPQVFPRGVNGGQKGSTGEKSVYYDPLKSLGSSADDIDQFRIAKVEVAGSDPVSRYKRRVSKYLVLRRKGSRRRGTQE